MPNYVTFNTNPDDLRTLIFGSDGTVSRPVAVDSDGRLLIGGVTLTATTIAGGTLDAVLGATITAGTLSAVESATIAGGTLDAVLGATITAGTLDSVTSISQKSFIEIIDEGVVTGDTFTPLAAVTTAVLGVYSYFIFNSGPNEADAQVEISADGNNWYVDVTTASPIGSGSVDVLVPKRFLKYTRLAYRSTNAGQSTTLNIYFNAQGT